MRIYTTAAATCLKTVKQQGAAIASAWQDQYGIRVDVRAIKRIGNDSSERQWGFVVLESLFSTTVCHYGFEGSNERGVRLIITPERQMTAGNRQYLHCPEKLLALTEVENTHWRECVRTYAAAVKGITADTVGDEATVFLLKSYSERHYAEPFFVLQKSGSQWYGIDCYGIKRPVGIGLGDVHDHCPSLIDVEAQRPMEAANLAPDCVNTGVLIYKENGDKATLLGRPMTKAEIVQDRLSKVPRFKFEMHGECPWAA